jgi:hypothetical protein
VGVLIGLAVGNNGKTVTQTQAGGQSAITRTVTQPTVEVRTKTVTTTTPSPAGAETEARAREAESNLRRVEKENEELKRQLERQTP